jgi:hypothetical protein
MKKAVEIIKRYQNFTFLDEDENEINIELSNGASSAEIFRFEKKDKIKLPSDLKELLMFSNGFDLFGLQILSLERMEFFPGEQILSFHNWGNGDFDCIALSGVFPSGTVLFMHHSEDNLIPVKNTFGDWLESVIKEVESKGTLLHPSDYNSRKEDGVYKQVWIKMNKN